MSIKRVNDRNKPTLAEPKDIAGRGKIKNKRSYFRLNEHIRIEVQKINAVKDETSGEAKIEKNGKIAEHFTNDISAGGLQFFSKLHYSDKMQLEITLYFKKTDPEIDPITVTGEVIKAEEIEKSQNQNVSVIFVNTDSKDRSLIERYIFIKQREMIAEKKIGFL